MTNEEGLAEQEGLSKKPLFQPEELLVKSRPGARTVEIRINGSVLLEVLGEEKGEKASKALSRFLYLSAVCAAKDGRGAKEEIKALEKELKAEADKFRTLTGVEAEEVRKLAFEKKIGGRKRGS